MNNKIVIFSGPTISPNEGNEYLTNAIWCGPAGQGDLLNAYLKYQPSYILLIDGLYENVPSVMHKEILYIMSKGVHVIGAGSLGALRASELNAFGMVGIGQIYKNYISGKMEDDDEVAIIHAPGELDYLSLSEALINIRYTLQHALSSKMLSDAEHSDLIMSAQALYYKDRTWVNVLNNCKSMTRKKRSILLKWVELNKIDVKKSDAITAIKYLKREIDQNLKSKKVQYHFESTVFFRRVLNECISERN